MQVHAGAIIPQWPPMLYFNEKRHDPLTLDLFPEGNSSFELYEDDGITRQYEQDMFAITSIKMSALANFTTKRKPDVTVTVSAMEGKGFVGQLKSRKWVLNVHSKAKPFAVTLKNGTGPAIVIPEYKSVSGCDARPFGWFYKHMAMENKAQKSLVYIRLPNMSTSSDFEVVISSGARSDHVGMEACDTVKHHQIQPQKFACVFDAACFVYTCRRLVVRLIDLSLIAGTTRVPATSVRSATTATLRRA